MNKLSVITILLLSIGLINCDKKVAETIIGTWTCDSFNDPCGAVTDDCPGGQLTFRFNFTFHHINSDQEETYGTYYVSGNTISVSYDGHTSETTFTLANGVLTTFGEYQFMSQSCATTQTWSRI